MNIKRMPLVLAALLVLMQPNHAFENGIIPVAASVLTGLFAMGSSINADSRAAMIEENIRALKGEIAEFKKGLEGKVGLDKTPRPFGRLENIEQRLDNASRVAHGSCTGEYARELGRQVKELQDWKEYVTGRDRFVSDELFKQQDTATRHEAVLEELGRRLTALEIRYREHSEVNGQLLALLNNQVNRRIKDVGVELKRLQEGSQRGTRALTLPAAPRSRPT